MLNTIAKEMVLVAWRTPPEQADDGSWFATFRPVELPRHIAYAEQDAGRCEVVND